MQNMISIWIFSLRKHLIHIEYVSHNINSHPCWQWMRSCEDTRLYRGDQKLIHQLTRWLYCVECPQYSIHLEALCYLCTSVYRSIRPSVTWLNSLVIGCLWLGDVSVICRAVNPHPTDMLETFRSTFHVWTVPARGMTWNWFNCKNGNLKSCRGLFLSEFLAICRPNHCAVMAAWSHKTLHILEKLRFLTTYSKIFKFMFWMFSSWHRSTCCVQICHPYDT